MAEILLVFAFVLAVCAMFVTSARVNLIAAFLVVYFAYLLFGVGAHWLH